ncbi:hypothetical protein LUD75_15750 [Epilithonimonas sp. JDS]|uniref:hypothetical protein n=1 Tax=Epilithonimonas sp. JDS TaxID=2902797 RepID=UPI001E34350A|nr:hypothetical protein [Epilithonimonas sp. JDS]MCD9856180.1 hypothetical protein [Epilithonimonas sp. JDS]
MKKFLPLLLILISSIFIFSCKDDDDDVQVQVEYPAVYDVNLNFIKDPEFNNLYHYTVEFNRALLNQDIVLVYRKNNPGANSPIWEPLPKTYYFSGGSSMDYIFDFTTADVQLTLDADFDLTIQDGLFKSTYLNGQTFRVVLVPAVFGKNSVDPRTLSYEEVIAKYNIDDSKIGKL